MELQLTLEGPVKEHTSRGNSKRMLAVINVDCSHFFFKPNSGLGRLIVEVPRSHRHTHTPGKDLWIS